MRFDDGRSDPIVSRILGATITPAGGFAWLCSQRLLPYRPAGSGLVGRISTADSANCTCAPHFRPPAALMRVSPSYAFIPNGHRAAHLCNFCRRSPTIARFTPRTCPDAGNRMRRRAVVTRRLPRQSSIWPRICVCDASTCWVLSSAPGLRWSSALRARIWCDGWFWWARRRSSRCRSFSWSLWCCNASR